MLHWDALPLGVADGTRIRGVTTAAGQARLRAGMTVSEARSRCAALRILPWDDVAIAAEVRRVTAALLAASPQVTPVPGAPGTWWVGASGFGALGGEEGLANTLRDIARRWHPDARVAIADSCVAARAATWDMRREARGVAEYPGTPVIVPPGGCAVYLSRTPLGLIPMDDEIRETLIALGIRTAGPLAALTAEDVERRWGSPGLAAWRLASGDDPRRPVLAHLEAARSVSAELSPSVSGTGPILFLVRAALDRLVKELIADGRAAAVVAITLTLDDARGAIPGGRAHTITREVRLSRPLARVVPLLERCRALLEKWELTAPVCAVGVTVPASAPLTGEQGELLDPAWRDPAAADAAFARLRAELGPNAIVRPVVRDEHRPEHAGGWLDVGEDGMVVDAGAGGTGGSVTRHPGPEAGARAGAGGPPQFKNTPAAPAPPHHFNASRPIPLPAPHVVPAATNGLSRSTAGGQDSTRDDHTGPASLSLTHQESTATGSPGNTWSAPVSLRLLGTPPSPSPSPSPSSPFGTPATQALSPAFELAAVFRHLESPEQISVECAGERPRALWWRGRHLRVRRAMGPERLAGDWWKDPYVRDYWRCEQGDPLVHLLIFRQQGPASDGAEWYVQGWYD